ncbi:MAG TPA: sulfate adenylyltransferase [Candidatus Paceibacterota bacterium]
MSLKQLWSYIRRLENTLVKSPLSDHSFIEHSTPTHEAAQRSTKYRKTKIIATLGPATKTEAHIRKLKDKGVDFVRVNMSHSSLDDQRHFMKLARTVGIPFILDTEGSQVRNGTLPVGEVYIEEGDEMKMYARTIDGTPSSMCLRPEIALQHLERGDLVYVDFNSLVFRVLDTSSLKESGYATTSAISSGTMGANKGVVIDSAMNKRYTLPPLSPKDIEAIKIALQEGVEYIAVSFVRSKETLDAVRKETEGKMKIISKIECVDALEHLDEIISGSDFLLIDRGDLSKEIPIEKIPLTQKIIMERARRKGVGVFVATNLLESMVQKKDPTRAEVHDVIQTVLDGAYGLTLAAETAIGKHPMEVVNTINKLIYQAEQSIPSKKAPPPYIHELFKKGYLRTKNSAPMLVAPHGGTLIDRIGNPEKSSLNKNAPHITITDEQHMDMEQIALGTFSPLTGFLCKKDLMTVLNTMRLSNGVVWPMPIVLDIDTEEARKLRVGMDAALQNTNKEIVGSIHVEDIYSYNANEFARLTYGTENPAHPGVALVRAMKPIFVGGTITLYKRYASETKPYELTPRQARRLFADRGWSKVVAFHTRNPIHRAHEFIQIEALKKSYADGLFIHPVVGKKKTGDFYPTPIVRAYDIMMKKFYPKNTAIFGTFATYSRYAGPREALFTALCRQNFGCSHIIVGRDHTGVGVFYEPDASQAIFDRYPDIGITPIRFKDVYYFKQHNTHFEQKEDSREHEQEHISGTEIRKMFLEGKTPPEWFMRPEISEVITTMIKNGENVFVTSDLRMGTVMWFTGLSGSGKTTIARVLATHLEQSGKKVCILDGDEIRKQQGEQLGFSYADIGKNNARIARIAQEKSKTHDFVLVSVIAPFKKHREETRKFLGKQYVEVFVDCPLSVCMQRDVKGLYAKASAGTVQNLIGVHDSHPYEVPEHPDVTLQSNTVGIGDCVKILANFLQNRKT